MHTISIVSRKEVRRYKRKEDTVERQRGKIKQTRFGNHKLLVCIGYMDRRRSIYRWQVLDI